MSEVDPRLWHACAGGLIQIPLPNSNVYYFPQGHAEQTQTYVDFRAILRYASIPPCILCKVIDVKFLADEEQEEVYAKITLHPIKNNERYLADGCTGRTVSDFADEVSYFVKKVTQADVYGGGLFLSQEGAEAVFPKLDYSLDFPFQTVIVKDVSGKIWKFRRVYEGVPKRHVLTTRWKTFLTQKKLVIGDAVVFVQAENGDLCVGIRRNNLMKNGRNINPEDVVKAASLAVKGEEFEVSYYPHVGTPEFVIKAVSVNSATRVRWCRGMRVKMAFEAEGLSRKSWFMGTVSSVRDAEPFLWPNSLWRCVQVIWDDGPDMLQKVKFVSPWLVELVSNKPNSHFPASIQGVRHEQFPTPLVDLDPTDELELTLFPKRSSESRPPKFSDDLLHGNIDLTLGRCSSYNLKKKNDKRIIRLFGQPIQTDPQVNCSSDENDKEKMVRGVGYVLTSLKPCEELYEQTLLCEELYEPTSS